MPQAPSVAQPPRIPLVVQPSNRDGDTDKDAKIINAYLEKNGEEYYVYKRPGLLATGSAKSGNGFGVYNWLGDIYSIFGTSLYKNGVLVGTVDGTGGVYRFAQSVGDTPRLQLGNGVASYNYDSGAGLVQIGTTATVDAPNFVNGIQYTILVAGTTNFTLLGSADNNPGTVFTAAGLGSTYAGSLIVGLTYIIDVPGNTDWTVVGSANNNPGTTFVATGVGAGTGSATAYSNGTGTATTTSNFPATCVKGWAYLDGTTYVMDSRASIRGCADLNNPTDWSDVLNRLTAQIEADNGVYLAHQLVYVVALGQWSTEVFYDAQNATASPLGPVQGAKINYGCVHQDSVQEIDGVLFWLATNRSSATQVIMVDNLKPTIVSTKPIERILSEASFGVVYSFGLKYAGHRFYGFTLRDDNITLVYDMVERLWYQWTDENGNYWPIVSSTYSSDTGRILQHESDGSLYLFDSAYTSDGGDPIQVDLYTPNFDGGTRRRKQNNLLEVVGDQTPGSVIQVRYNDNDYKADSWTPFRSVDMNVKRPILTENGTFVKRAWNFRHRCDTRMRIQAVELQLDIGTL